MTGRGNGAGNALITFYHASRSGGANDYHWLYDVNDVRPLLSSGPVRR